jgi:hypothetical protein
MNHIFKHALAGIGLLAFGTTAAPAATMTCAIAMTLENNNPGIETSSIISIVNSEWQTMDQQTIQHGAAPIAQKMASGPTYYNMLSAQCQTNPGQPLHAAAAQVYRVARSAMDGF